MSADDIRAHRDLLLQRMVSDPDPVVRSDTAAALAYVARDETSIPAFAAALGQESDPNVQRRLVAILVSFSRSDVAVQAVVDFALSHPDPPPYVVTALAGADPRRVRSALDAADATRADASGRLREDLCGVLPGSAWCEN